MTRVGRLGCGWEADPCRDRYPQSFCSHSHSHFLTLHLGSQDHLLYVLCKVRYEYRHGHRYQDSRQELMGERLHEDREISR